MTMPLTSALRGRWPDAKTQRRTLQWRARKGSLRPFAACSINHKYSDLLQVSEEVRDAVAAGKPVIALESTIYTHGVPYPESLRLAKRLENLARTHGAVPATIGILSGKCKIGMSHTEIEELLDPSNREKAMKVSRREVAFVCGAGLAGKYLNGGTTVAATSLLAHLAGISIFATGGLGGVHRGGELSMDVSADLTELGRTPIAVISSGIKSFLDIPRTLEYLETHGVGVATFSDAASQKRADFPAFWSRDSGVPSPLTIGSSREAAGLVFAMKRLDVQSGILLANPVPQSHSIPRTHIDQLVSHALDEATARRITGSACTPFVLSRILELSGGKTLKANLKLVEANVVRAAEVAVELQTLEAHEKERLKLGHQSWTGSLGHPAAAGSARGLLVAGAVATDLVCSYRPSSEGIESPRRGTSNPATVSENVGGVGQNIATAAHLCGVNVHFCSIVGDDDAGERVVQTLRQRGMDVTGIYISKHVPTARYVAFNNARGGLELAMSDMAVLERQPGSFDALWQPLIDLKRPYWVALDGNWDRRTLHAWIRAARNNAKVAYEPVSMEKATKIFRGIVAGDPLLPPLDLATPNIMELEAMAKASHGNAAWKEFIGGLDRGSILRGLHGSLEWPFQHLTPDTPVNALALLPHIRCVLTKAGPDGVLMTEVLPLRDRRLRDPLESGHILFRASGDKTSPAKPHLPAPEPHAVQWCDDFAGVYMRHFKVPIELQGSDLVNTNGSGDTFLGVLLAGLVSGRDRTVADLVQIAQSGAALTLQSTEPVSPELWTLAAQFGNDGQLDRRGHANHVE